MTGFDIIIIAMIAAFVLLRLRSELGTKTGNEPQPPMHPRGHSADYDHDYEQAHSRENYGQAPKGESAREDVIIDLEENPAVRQGYLDIRRADPGFDPRAFVDGARQAYSLILEAFWSGDHDALRPFLADEVFEQFSTAMDQRANEGLSVEGRVLNVTSADVTASRLHGATAEITVHFKAEIVCVTRDSDNNIVDGDPSDAIETNDIWTFSRNTLSGDPNWSLVATRTG